MIRIAVVLSLLLATTTMATAAMAKAWWPEPLRQLIAAHAGWPQMVSRPSLDPYGIAQTDLLVDSQCKVTVQVADLQLLALLPADRSSYALVSGRDCTECDEAMTLRLVPLSCLSGDIAAAKLRYVLPGQWLDGETGALVEQGRTFYGRCLQSQHAEIIWFRHVLMDHQRWLRVTEVLRPEQPPLQEIPVTVTPAYLAGAIKTGQCQELAGRQWYTAP